jgi:2-polyprenyl-3-methyl-5-hydroxy-6-metoxy-1,4-benzoquinol methylase
MDIAERMTVEQARGPGLVASEHVHRYEFAVKLCAGLRVADIGCGVGYGSSMLREVCPAVTGVDYDSGTIEVARQTFGRDGLDFVQADGVEFLREPLDDRFDGIVMFECLEHLPKVDDALASLERHAENGLRLIISVPNSRAFGEENPHHWTDFSYDGAMAAFKRFADMTIVYQFLAEGSLIRTGSSGRLIRHTVLEERGEPEYANHFIACVNCGDRAELAADRARMELVIAPNYNRHMTNLERATESLRLANARLARSKLGTADSAAAALQGRIRTLEDELAARSVAADEAHRRWIEDLHAQIEDLRTKVTERQRLIEEMQATRAWQLAGRYRRLRDRARRLVGGA